MICNSLKTFAHSPKICVFHFDSFEKGNRSFSHVKSFKGNLIRNTGQFLSLSLVFGYWFRLLVNVTHKRGWFLFSVLLSLFFWLKNFFFEDYFTHIPNTSKCNVSTDICMLQTTRLLLKICDFLKIIFINHKPIYTYLCTHIIWRWTFFHIKK